MTQKKVEFQNIAHCDIIKCTKGARSVATILPHSLSPNMTKVQEQETISTIYANISVNRGLSVIHRRMYKEKMRIK